MQTLMHLSITIAHDLLLADDCELNIATELDGQQSMNHFASDWANLELVANTEKTVVVYQPSPNTECNDAHITGSDTQIKTVDSLAL
nr:unnamed protein product [Spirometra erinaceieuropaei]